MANTSLPALTERTATANSDLIHVNSGGTDYKETKANFLSDVNSSISALNNSLANIGKNLVDISQSYNLTASFAYTGCSFTISKKAIVRVSLYYTYNVPSEVAICGSASGNQFIYAHASAVSGVTNIIITCTALLDAGTYYVWGKSSGEGANRIGVLAVQIEP